MNLDLNKWRPARGKILGEIIQGNYETESGILVVDSLKKKKPKKVRVVAIGGTGHPEINFVEVDERPGFYNEKDDLEMYRALPYETAYFKTSEGQRLTINRKEYLILENKDIIAVES